jgi:hypothetical protein
VILQKKRQIDSKGGRSKLKLYEASEPNRSCYFIGFVVTFTGQFITQSSSTLEAGASQALKRRLSEERPLV